METSSVADGTAGTQRPAGVGAGRQVYVAIVHARLPAGGQGLARRVSGRGGRKPIFITKICRGSPRSWQPPCQALKPRKCFLLTLGPRQLKARLSSHVTRRDATN